MPESTLDADAFHDGESAARELREALALAGFTLPSLRGDFPIDHRPHVQLGGASGDVVRRLASWIRGRATASADASE